MNPRKPTEAEKNELVTYLLVNDDANDKDEREQLEGFVKSAAIAVLTIILQVAQDMREK